MNKKISVILLSGAVLIAVLLWWGYSRNASVIELKSDDGNVTLAISRDALPEGVRAEDIKITSLGYDAMSAKPAKQDFLAGYEFQPDGLVFKKPVEVSFVLKNFDGGSIPLVDMVGTDGAEPLGHQRVKIDVQSKTASIAGEITHFSYSVLHRGFLAIKLSSPGDHFVGDTFQVEGIQSIEKRSYIFSSDVSQITSHTLVENPDVWGVASAHLPRYRGDTTAVKPNSLLNFPATDSKIPENGELKSIGNLTCVEPGEAELGYVVRITNGGYDSRERGFPNRARGERDDFSVPEDPSHPDIVRRHKISIDVAYTGDTFNCLARQAPAVSPALQVGEPIQEMIQVISYGGKYIPIAQLKIENETGCGEPHYHAPSGSVTTTDGTQLHDPGPPCGYGKVSQRPTTSIARTGNETTAIQPPPKPATSKPSGGTVVVCGLPGGPACPRR